MIEKIALFGEAKHLVGVVTEPSVASTRPKNLAFLLLNAGVIHHVGPNRLNVKLARRLSAAGFTAVRFDLSGIGDSRSSQSTLPFEAQAVADIRAAMDHMEATRDLRRFVLIGLCSGADNAFATARADTRAIGLVMLDPYAYPTWQTGLRFLLRRLVSPTWLASYLRRRVRRALGGPRRPDERSLAEPRSTDEPSTERYRRQQPALADFATGLMSVLDRGGAAMVFYSGSSTRQFNYTRQMDDALQPYGLAGRIHCRFWRHANHTFTELSAQAELLDSIVMWAGELSDRIGNVESSADGHAVASSSM